MTDTNKRMFYRETEQYRSGYKLHKDGALITAFRSEEKLGQFFVLIKSLSEEAMLGSLPFFKSILEV